MAARQGANTVLAAATDTWRSDSSRPSCCSVARPAIGTSSKAFGPAATSSWHPAARQATQGCHPGTRSPEVSDMALLRTQVYVRTTGNSYIPGSRVTRRRLLPTCLAVRLCTNGQRVPVHVQRDSLHSGRDFGQHLSLQGRCSLRLPATRPGWAAQQAGCALDTCVSADAPAAGRCRSMLTMVVLTRRTSTSRARMPAPMNDMGPCLQAITELIYRRHSGGP